MVEHCHKCGTELAADQARHRTYRVESPADDQELLTGRLCSDCVVAFEEWLNQSRIVEEDA